MKQASSDWLGGRLSSLEITESSTCWSLQAWHHLGWVWRHCGNSFFHRHQNSSPRCCTLLQYLLEYLSESLKIPGGSTTILDFIVRRWLGVNGDREIRIGQRIQYQGSTVCHSFGLTTPNWVALFSSGVQSTFCTIIFNQGVLFPGFKPFSYLVLLVYYFMN